MRIERYTYQPVIGEYLVVDETTTADDLKSWVWMYVAVSTDKNTGAIIVAGTPLTVGDRVDKGGTRYPSAPEGMQLVTATNPAYVIEEKA